MGRRKPPLSLFKGMLSRRTLNAVKEAIAEVDDEIFTGNGKRIHRICLELSAELDPLYASKSENLADVLLTASQLEKRFDEDRAQDVLQKLKLILADIKNHFRK